MEKEFVPFKLAVKLKELGFDEPCFYYFNSSENNQLWQDTEGGYYRNSTISVSNLLWGETFDNGNVSAPLWQQVLYWLREVHKIDIAVNLETIDDSTTEYTYEIVQYISEGFNSKKNTWDFYKRISSFTPSSGWYSIYEEAREEALFQALNLLPDAN